jgi:hypothetical protein
MYNIPWKLYSEEEIQEVLTYLFSQKGYEVYNLHKVDRSGEDGVDLECNKEGETEKLLIAVKVHPRSKDVEQLKKLAAQPSKTKIYVFSEEPTSKFKKEMVRLQRKVSFWNSEKLTSELFNTTIGFYLWLVVENYFEKDLFGITLSFCKIYVNLKKRKRKPHSPVEANNEMINLLWNAKDRSVSLHRSLRTLQAFFEETNLYEITEDTKKTIIHAFLGSLAEIHQKSLRPLRRLFEEFIIKYPGNFDQFCLQTANRSNWMQFLTYLPQLSPGHIIESFEKAKKESLEYKELFDKLEVEPSAGESHLGEILANISQILANVAYFLEDTVDDLLSIGLLGSWDALRKEFSKVNVLQMKIDHDEEM